MITVIGREGYIRDYTSADSFKAVGPHGDYHIFRGDDLVGAHLREMVAHIYTSTAEMYPRREGEGWVLGPGVILSGDSRVLNFNGQNYYYLDQEEVSHERDYTENTGLRPEGEGDEDGEDAVDITGDDGRVLTKRGWGRGNRDHG